ncbi:MAG: NUMOD4 motif-containing HNH endonuclease [Alistipes sp.]|nr:NUMOD4 motif-containing HNH endonuclease [Alistipes sp.]
MQEIWKPIPGYEGYYEASSYGRVRSIERVAKGRRGFAHIKSHILKPNNVHDGYKQVKFSINGIKAQPLLHRLIAITFVPNPLCLPQVNHIDGNKENNHADNLEWCTAAYNSQHRSRVLKKWVGHPKKKVMCINTGIIYESSHHASRELNISQGGIFSVCQGKGKTAGGLKFVFTD